MTIFNRGVRGKRSADGTNIGGISNSFVENKYPIPSISGYTISGTDDTALDPAGGQTVLVNGTGFATGISATLAGTQIGSVTLVSPTQISFTSPAKAGGSYSLVVYNSTGGAAILVPGLTYSSVPTFTTAAGSIGSYYETTAISTSVVATSDSAITYSLASGSLPSGATLYGNGVITGTSPVDSSSTTYTFDITATDAELQDVTRTFTLTINTDVVSWVSPADGTSYALTGNQAMSNVALSATSAAGYNVSYSANALPTGVTLSGNTISGTPTEAANTSTLLTATSSTTNRTATRTVNWVVTLGDSYWKQVSLLVSGDPITSTFINDASLNNSQISIVSDARPSMYSPYSGGYYSNYFDGSGDYLNTSATIGLAPGTGDFTLEFWINFTATANRQDLIWWGVDANDRGGILWNLTSGSLTYYISPTVGNAIDYAWTPVVGTWYHIALVRSSGSSKLYINGVQSSTTYSDSKNYASSSYLATIGKDNTASSSYFFGYMSNLRFVKGTAVYTSNFTPSTIPLPPIANTQLLTCQSNRFIDSSTNNLTITKNADVTISPAYPFTTPTTASYNTLYSTYFDGTGDYLTTPTSITNLVNFPSGTDYTIECWVYPTAAVTNQEILGSYSGAVSGRWILRTASDGLTPNLYVYPTGEWTFTAGSGAMTLNTWNHIAMVRIGSTTKGYLNGVERLSTTTVMTLDGGSNSLYIGAAYSGRTPWNGNISNVRIVKGLGVYTGAFTVPTTSLTATQSSGTNISAITGTSTTLLTCQNETLIDNSTNAYAITSAADARPIAVSPFTMTTSNTTVTSLGSSYFDGSLTYLQVPYNASIGVLSGDFTIEIWFYPLVSNMSAGTLFTHRNFSTNQYVPYLVWLVGTTITVYMSSNAGSWNVINGASGGTAIVGAWNHFTIVRFGSSIKTYLNGVAQSASATSSAVFTNPSIPLNIGNSISDTSPVFNGYMSDFRIVNGTALYKANFLPPQTPLTPVTNTSLLTLQYNGGATNNGFVDRGNYKNIVTRGGNANQGTFSPYSQNGWSVYFDGTSATFDITTGTITIGTSTDHTMEAWIFMVASTNAQNMICCGLDTGLGFYISSGLNVVWNKSNVGGGYTSTGTISLNQWTHVAVSRQSGTARFWINGVLSGSNSDATSFSSTHIQVGAAGASLYFKGYISNLRQVVGTALYTSAFTPSTTPLTAVTNTVSLTCQSNRFIDTSSSAGAITQTGSPSIQAYSPFGGITVTPAAYSAYFDGSTYVVYPAAGSSNVTPQFGLGRSDFTIESWFRVVNSDSFFLWDLRSSGNTGQLRPMIGIDGNAITMYTGAGTTRISYSFSMTSNVWHHIALVRISGNTKMYFNGTQVGSTYVDTNDYGDANTFTVSSVGDSPGYAQTELLGSISNMRFVRGIGVYTGNFTVPTSPLQLTQSAGTNIAAIGTIPTNGNSVYFDGSGDYLTTPTFTLTLATWTMEFWLYTTSTTQYQTFVHRGNGASWSVTSIWDLYMTGTTSGLLQFLNGTGGVQLNGITVINDGVWHHVAITYDGTNYRLFVDGKLDAYQAGSAMSTASYLFYLGYDPRNTRYTAGSISNFRFVDGSVVYSTSSTTTGATIFTPPTSPLTAISNTQLLTCQSDTLRDNSLNGFYMTVAGNTVVSKSWSPFGYNTSFLGFQTYDGRDSSVNLVGQTQGGGLYTPSLATPFGNNSVTSSSPVSYTTSVNGGSMYFDGSSDYIEIPHATNQWLAASTNFTLECWVYIPTSVTGEHIITAKGYQGSPVYGIFVLAIGTTSNMRLIFLSSTNGSGWQIQIDDTTALVAGTWYHVAVVRSDGSTIRMYKNGVSVGTPASNSSAFYNHTGAFRIGSHSSGSWWSGYIAEPRLIIGTAVYTNNFIPPASPLTPVATIGVTQAPSTLLVSGTAGGIIDYHSSNNLETVGNTQLAPENPYAGSYYSNYFDGSGDYLSVSTGTIATGTGDLTLECWAYRISTTSLQTVVNLNTYLTGILIRWETTKVTIYVGGTDYSYNTPTDIPLGAWVHIALVRTSGVFRFYVNGVQATTFNTNYSLSITSVTIGTSSHDTSDEFYGYISNVRFVSGTAIIPPVSGPTAPLTAITNTAVLTCQSNTFKDNSTNAFAITRTGDTAVKSFNPFQQNTGKSLYFDGTGDYIITASSPTHSMGTGDFTVEGWVYFPTLNGTDTGCFAVSASSQTSPSNNAISLLYVGASKYWAITYNNTYTTSTTVAVAGQWIHFAIVRSSGTTKLYINGTSIISTADTYNYSGTYSILGFYYSTTYLMTGYIKDFRVTKGVARYTTTFTPPTSPLQTK